MAQKKLKKPNKKPTLREIGGVVIELNKRINDIRDYCNQLDRIIGLILKMNNQEEQFNQYLDKLKAEYEQKANDATNEKDLQGDPDGERAGAEGVREERK